ncbi:MAG: 2-polyprenyl-3-methyl-6-methoxy-1,4-benzoquinone monooxygenase [Gammaproteobacteria bacterium]|nr:2-polyprenyl-3-methyl-6-methoxy-1,4-benzoquinone monooxygenase [Gammaproteobacteria bacterium]
MRHTSPLDNLLSEVGHTLNTLFARASTQTLHSVDDAALSDSERKLSEGLMRVNHTGEICAQALYRGQAFFAKTPEIKSHLLQAADEETAHLNWCQSRLTQLDTHTSYLNPFWYTASFSLGVIAGAAGDAWSLGFVAETENQVSEHLKDHLQRLPEQDQTSRKIVKAMLDDETRHAEQAMSRGGRELPKPIKMLMSFQSKVMTSSAYYL